MSYCASRFHTVRRPTLEVKVGGVGVGGSNPIRVQSMTTSDTQDIAATVRQSIALAEAGCEIVRITAPNPQAAKCLRDIRSQFSAAGFGAIPLVADIHFLPSAAMEAVEHVEKVRVNPGNYADRKRFAVREYTDADYERELQRLHEAFSPLVKRSKELGRSMRIGTNHGSLSDRIMNRYGDTPLGMVESALEFLRIAESHGFRQIILSMKSSNPKVMIEAYRLLVERMDGEDMHYPLHLGVTEAGDGEDGRIKGSIGIGSLLLDGLGDTIRVSLTEDSVYEIPVAKAIAEKAMSLWAHGGERLEAGEGRDSDDVDPYHFTRRETGLLRIGKDCAVGPEQPPRVIVRVKPDDLGQLSTLFKGVKLQDTPVEGLLLSAASAHEVQQIVETLKSAAFRAAFAVLELDPSIAPDDLPHSDLNLVLLRRFKAGEGAGLAHFANKVRKEGWSLAIDATPADVEALGPTLRALGDSHLLFTLSDFRTSPPASPLPPPTSHLSRPTSPLPPPTSAVPPLTSKSEPAGHSLGAYRELIAGLAHLGSRAPIWIRNTPGNAIKPGGNFLSNLIEASMLTGGLLCDGLGDLVSVESEADPARALRLAYNLLQGAGARVSKTEFVACPSCGRTLFDLQETTRRIREQTGHLKGLKIAIMGCIVNGPGEMADADFGYVGGAPGKINLYVGKQCVQYNVPQSEADARLIAIIREHGKWAEPAPAMA